MNALTPLAVSSEPLLRALAELGLDASSKKLADAAGKKINNIARDLDILASAGLIVRHPPHLTQSGLEALAAIDRAKAGPAPAAVDGVAEIRLDLIERDPTLNPRQVFDEDDLESLAASIADKGVVQPILLRQGLAPGLYRIVAGERRFRASKLAGKEAIPAVIRQLTDSQALEIALIENIQRTDLNPMEEARAFGRIIEARKAEHPEASERDAKEVIAEATRKTVRFVEMRLQLLQLTPKDQERMFLPKGDPRALNVESARWAVQEHNRALETAKSKLLKPAELLILAELVDKVAKAPAEIANYYYGGKPTEIDYRAKPPESLLKRNFLTIIEASHQELRTCAKLGWQIDAKDVRAQTAAYAGGKKAEALDKLRRAVVGDAEADRCAHEGCYATAWLNGPFEPDPKAAKHKAKLAAEAAEREAEIVAARERSMDQLAAVKSILGAPGHQPETFTDVPAALGIPLPWHVEPWGDIVAANGNTVDDAGDWRHSPASAGLMAMQLLVVTAVHRAANLPDPEPPTIEAAPPAPDEEEGAEAAEQACRVCGCTETDACITDDGPCHWVEPDLCSNPDCVDAAAQAHADAAAAEPLACRDGLHTGPLAPMLNDQFAQDLRDAAAADHG